MKKNDRLELIRKIVQENKITTQGELVKLLQNEGYKATLAPAPRVFFEIGNTLRRFIFLWVFNCS